MEDFERKKTGEELKTQNSKLKTTQLNEGCEIIESVEVFQVPANFLLAPKAQVLYQNLLSLKGYVSLDYIAETIAQIAQETFEYEFLNILKTYSATDLIRAKEKRYQETIRPQEPTLKGVCLDGVIFCCKLLQSLNLDSVVIEPFYTYFEESDNGHCLISIKSSAGMRLINVLSSSVNLGVIAKQQELEIIGEPINSSLSFAEGPQIVFNSPAEKVLTNPQEAIFPVFKHPPHDDIEQILGMTAYSSQMVVEVRKSLNPDNYLAGRFMPVNIPLQIDQFPRQIFPIRKRVLPKKPGKIFSIIENSRKEIF